MTLIEEDPITMRPRDASSTSGSIGTQEALTGTILRQQQAAAVRRIEQQAEQRAEYVDKRKLRSWIKKSQRPKGKVAAPSQKATEISAIAMEKKTGRPRGQNLLENVSRVEQKKLQEWAESERSRAVEETIGIAEGQQTQYEWQMAELRAQQMREWSESIRAEGEAIGQRSEEFRTAKAYGYDSYEELQRAVQEEKAIKRANELGLALAETEQITQTIARSGYAGAAAEYGRDPGGMLAQQTAIVTAAQKSISQNFSDVITVDAKGYQGYLQEASSYAGKVKDLESRPAEPMTVQVQSVPKGWIGGTESSRVLAMQQQADETAGRALGRLGEVAGSVRQTLAPAMGGKQNVLDSATIFTQEAPAVRKLNREDLITYPVAKGTDISLEYLGNEFTRWKLAGDEGIRRTVSRPMDSLPEPAKVWARGMIPGFDTIPERLRNLKDMGIGIGKLVTMGGMSSAYVVPSLEWAAREPEAYAAVIGPATVLSFEQMAEEAQREPWEAAGAAMFMIAGPKASPIKYQRYSVPTGRKVTVPKWGKVFGPLTEVPEVVTYRGISAESPGHTVLKGGGFEPDWAGFETGSARHIGGITTKGPKPRAGLEVQMGKGKQLFETFKESTVYQIQSDVMAQRYALRLKPEEQPAFLSLYELSKDVRKTPADLIELHEPTLASSGAIRDPSGRVVADPKALKTAMIETDQVLYGSSLHEVMFGKAGTPGRTARFAGDIETMPIGRSESAAKHGIFEMAKAYPRGEVKRKGGKFPSYEIEVGGEALGGAHWGEYPFRVTKRGDRYIETVDPSHPKHLSQRRTLLPKPGEDVPIVKVPQSSRDIIQLESGLLIESPKIQFLRKLESMTGIDVEAGTFGARSARLGKDLFDIGEYVTLYEQSALKTYQKTGKPEYRQQAKQYRERWETVMENPRMKAAYEEFTADFMKTYPKQKAAAVALERRYGAPAPTTGRPFSEVVALDPWKLGADFLPGEVKASVGVPKHLEWVVKREGFIPQSDAPITIPLMQRVLRDSGRGEASAIFSAELKAMREFTKPTKPPVVRDPYEVITEVERLPEGRETRQQLLDLIKNVAPEAEIGGSFGMAIQSRKGKSGIPQDIDLSVADPLAVSKALKEQYFDIHLKPTETRVSGHGGIERHNPQSGEWYHAMDIHGLDKRPLFGEMDIGRYGLTVGGPITVKGLKIKPFKELALRKISNIAAMSREQIGTKTIKTETLSPSKLAIKDGMMVETGRVPKVVEKEVPVYEYFTAPEKHRGKDIADSLMALESHTKALSESIIEPAYIPKQVRLEDIRTDIGKVLKEGHLPVTKSGGKVYDQRTQALERMKSVHPENPLGIETVTKDILIDMGTEFRTGKTTVVKPESRFFRLPGTSRYFENPFAMQTHAVRRSISDIVSGRRELPIGFSTRMVGQRKGSPVKMDLDMPTTTTGKRPPEPAYPYGSKPAPKKSKTRGYTIPLSEKIYNISQRSKSPEGSKEGYIPRSRFTAKFTYRPEYRPGKLTYKIDYKPPEYRPSEYKIDYKPPGYKPPVYKPPGYVFTSRIHPPPPPPPPPPPRLLWGGKDKKRTKKVRHSIFGALEMQHNIKLWDEVLFGTSKKPMKERTSPFLTVMTGNRQFTIPKTQLGATKKRLKKEKTRIEAIQF